MSVFKYYLNTEILTLVFKYLLIVFKYLTIAYNNHPLTKVASSLITLHILCLHDFVELSDDERHISKVFMWMKSKLSESFNQ